MLGVMRARLSKLFVAVAMLTVMAIVIAAPVHAAHHHGNEQGHIQAPCAICQMQSPACRPLSDPPSILSLEPLFVLATGSVMPCQCATAMIVGTRAPPVSLA